MFDLQFRREADGWVLRVVIDRPDAPAGAAGQEPVGIEDCQRVSHDLSALLDVEDELTAGSPEATPWRSRRPVWIGRCAAKRTIGGSWAGWRRS